MTYASGTSVSVDKSKAEIERMVVKRGARKFGTMTDENHAYVMFQINDRSLQFEIKLPDISDKRFTKTPTGKARQEPAIYKEWEAECRRVWRALAAVIKAKFIAVEDNVYTFDEAFLSDIVLHNGMTMGRLAVPQIAESYANKKMPPLLSAAPGNDRRRGQ